MLLDQTAIRESCWLVSKKGTAGAIFGYVGRDCAKPKVSENYFKGLFIQLYSCDFRTVSPLFKKRKNIWDDIDTMAQVFRKSKKLERDSVIKNETRTTLANAISSPKDFTELLQLVTSKPVILTLLNCPNCGGKLGDLPTATPFLNCKFCGEYIHVTDVYAMVKDAFRV